MQQRKQSECEKMANSYIALVYASLVRVSLNILINIITKIKAYARGCVTFF